MKKLIIICLLAAIIAFSVFLYLLFTGPRMRTQVNIKPFQAQMPLMPKGTVPVSDAYDAVPDANEMNPLAATAENYARGKIYYTYYCDFCHGQSGAGDGPVGQSYVPVPSDLRVKKNRSLRTMLTGTGHDPVLKQIVPSEHRWYIELYVRSLSD